MNKAPPVITHRASSEEKVRYINIRYTKLTVNLCQPPGCFTEAYLTSPS